MKFRTIEARKNWKEQANELGYITTLFDDPPYWAEALPEPETVHGILDH